MPGTNKSAPSVREALLGAITKMDRPGTFCSWGDLPMVMPGLEVDQVGVIRLPLGKAQARKLIQQCSPAPYGKGTQTLVDAGVRRAWELDPGRFRLTNPKWDELIRLTTAHTQLALGLDDRKLSAHLYKLLVYEEGGFFLPHQDGEKLDGMVATLVVALPSEHTGGELIVSHEGRQHKIDFAAAASGIEPSYAAFYSDCQHEVLPIRSGFRLCLTYNLTLARSRGGRRVTAPSSRAVVAELVDLLRNWASGDDPQKLAVTLEHQYSQEGLTLEGLKGVDRPRADTLLEAAEQADCEARLALVTHWQSGSAEGAWDDYHARRRGGRRYWSNDDDDDDDEGSGERARHKMGELFDESLSADHWCGRDGERDAFGRIELEPEEVVADRPCGEWEVSQEEFEGYTGNAGMTLERWYHRAAVVIWPKRSHFQLLCAAGTDAAVAGLAARLAKLKRLRKAEREQERDACVRFAGAIISGWAPERRHVYSYNESHTPAAGVGRSCFLPMLRELAEPELVRRFLAEVISRDGEVPIDPALPQFCKEHGWRGFADAFSAVMEASTATTIARNAELLRILCVVRDKDQDRVELCGRLAETLTAAVVRIDAEAPAQEWRGPRFDRAEVLGDLVKSCVAVDATQPLRGLLGHAMADATKHDLISVHLKALFAIEAWLTRRRGRGDAAISEWLAYCRAELLRRTAEAPRPPEDLRRRSVLSCRCADCRELSLFLDNPHEESHRFAVRQERRQHLHEVINRNRCDLTHVTSRSGRPHTLVCTKTTASHEKALQLYLSDKQHLERLLSIEEALRAPE